MKVSFWVCLFPEWVLHRALRAIDERSRSAVEKLSAVTLENTYQQYLGRLDISTRRLELALADCPKCNIRGFARPAGFVGECPGCGGKLVQTI